MKIYRTTTTGLIAAAVLVAGGVLMPAAHAGPNCAVSGLLLQLHHGTGYDVSVDANGSSLGPNAVVRTPQQTSDGTVSNGAVNGRAIVFNVNFPGSKGYIHFEGTVGQDGVAHGTSSSLASPVKVDAGAWDSITNFTC